MEKLSVKLQKLILWVSSYVSILAILLSGGYALRCSQNEEIKKTAVQAFVVKAIFIGISAFLSLLDYFIIRICLVTDFSRASSILTALASIAEIVTYAVMVILTLTQKETAKAE